MSSRFGGFIAVLILVGCSVEHGNQPPQRPAARGEAASPHGAPQSGAVGPMHQVFDRMRDTVVPGVERMTLSVMLAQDQPREAQRATLEAVAEAQRREDSSLAAIRVLGFLPHPGGGGEERHPMGMRLIPFAILEWVPAEGWNGLSAANRRSPRRTSVTFVSDLPQHPRVPGAR
jgi:hypothetical protein